MTAIPLTSPEPMENKTQTQPPEFKEVSVTMTEAQILADSYSISKSISNIILKQYSREMKKKSGKNDNIRHIVNDNLRMCNYQCEHTIKACTGISY